MKVFGTDQIEALLDQEFFTIKAVMNDLAVSLFPPFRDGQEYHHAEERAGGLHYEVGGGNALALIIKPGLIEIFHHAEFSEERVDAIVKELKALPELKFALNFKVTYQGRVLDPGNLSTEEHHPGPVKIQKYDTAQYTEGAGNVCRDKVKVISDETRTVITLADGAGASGEAAQQVIDFVSSYYRTVETRQQWEEVLRSVDHTITVGESTAVVIDIGPNSLSGASVGDSEAWVFFNSQIFRLTGGQQRKPLLGSQKCRPVSFEFGPLSRMLLVGSDGFFNYVKQERILSAITGLTSSSDNFFDVPRNLANMARLPSGKLQDDISIVACRPRPIGKSRTIWNL